MSLELAAKHLASRGRNGDTELVHMTKGEVAGLQALAKAHGGKLTTNPETGLPEAFFLAALLPTLIGGAGATLGMSKLGIAALGAGAGALMNRRNPLMGAVMGGLGAFGGAGLASGLKAAAGAAGAAGAVPAMSMAPAVASPAFDLAAAAGAAPAAAPAMSMAPAVASPAATGLASSLAVPATPSSSMLSTLGQGFRALATPEGRDAFMGQAATKTQEATGVGGVPGLLRAGLTAAAPAMMMPPTTQAPRTDGGPNYEYTYDSDAGQYTRVPVGTRDTLTQMPRMFADGGPVATMSDRNEALTLMANQGQMFAAGGGVSHLGDYSDGGRLLKGPGDGVSDSIPATIADKRPARLADGEFVVPARIVSELGNGSTDAGARKLYAMMDRIQKARGKTTGKDRVAVNSKADRLLPA